LHVKNRPTKSLQKWLWDFKINVIVNKKIVDENRTLKFELHCSKIDKNLFRQDNGRYYEMNREIAGCWCDP